MPNHRPEYLKKPSSWLSKQNAFACPEKPFACCRNQTADRIASALRIPIFGHPARWDQKENQFQCPGWQPERAPVERAATAQPPERLLRRGRRCNPILPAALKPFLSAPLRESPHSKIRHRLIRKGPRRASFCRYRRGWIGRRAWLARFGCKRCPFV